MSAPKRAHTHIGKKEVQRRRCAIAAQRLEHDADLYKPDIGMFASACKCWRYIEIMHAWNDDEEGKTAWYILREEGRLTIPRFDPTDEPIETEFTGMMERQFPLEQLQTICRRLDNDDMAAFFQYLVISEKRNFDTMFTPDFVGDDARLAYIRDFIAAHGNPGPPPLPRFECFFDGRKQADKAKVFEEAHSSSSFVPPPPAPSSTCPCR